MQALSRLTSLLSHSPASLQLVLADPYDACTPLLVNYSDKVVIFGDGGNCSDPSSLTLQDLGTKASNVKAANAAAGEWFAERVCDQNVVRQ